MPKNWLEMARAEFRHVPKSQTVKTDTSPVLSVMAVAENSPEHLRVSHGSVSFDSASSTDKLENKTAELQRDAYEERVAIIEANGIPREWAEGYAALCTMPCPTAYSFQRWERMINDGGLFLDSWGREAATLGWNAWDVFGVNPDAPESRYDGMGLVPLLCGKAVIAITADTARIESGKKLFVTFYRKTRAENSIVLWEAFKS